jgi:hypothetical protein
MKNPGGYQEDKYKNVTDNRTQKTLNFSEIQCPHLFILKNATKLRFHFNTNFINKIEFPPMQY